MHFNQLLRVMHLTAIFLTVCCLQVGAIGLSQKVSFSGKNVHLKDVFDAVKKQTNFFVIYEKEAIENAERISIDLKDVPLHEFLQKVLVKTPFSFSLEETTIVIKERLTPSGALKYPAISPSLPPPITVRGRIINEKGEPVIASVIIKGSNKGTTSTADGFFELAGVDEKATLIFSGANINTKEVLVDGKSVLNVSVLLKIEMEEEVVINKGYYTEKKRLSTGSVSKVTNKEIGNQPVVSPLLTLQGRVPGLEITMVGNAAPGVAPKIRIRGTNSLRVSTNGKATNGGVEYDGNYSLYVIDGVPFSSIPVGGLGEGLTTSGYDPLSNINPESIESIEVLKDADATSIYGSRGANGVILITTKSGVKNVERAILELNVYKGIGQVPRKLKLLNTEEYLRMRHEGLANDGLLPRTSDYDIKFWSSERFTDWQEMLLGQSAHIADVQAGILAGNKTTSFRFGIGYHGETLATPGDFGYSRISGQMSVNHTSKNQRLKLNLVTNYGFDKNRLFNGQLTSDALSLPPNAPRLYNDDGTLNWELHNINGTSQNTWINPLSRLLQTTEPKSSLLVTSANISYRVLPEIIFSVNMGYTSLVFNSLSKDPIYSKPPSSRIGSQELGIATFSNTHRISWSIEPQMRVSKELGEHSFDIVLGMSWQKNQSEVSVINGEGYTSDAFLNSLSGAARINVLRHDAMEYKYISGYGRVGYNWKKRYVLNLTGRRDGSSRFGPNNRFGNFGAIGVGWIFSDEPAIQEKLHFLNFGKFRSSYGISGNDAVQDYGFYNLYRLMGSTTYQGSVGLLPTSLYNPNYVWETTRKLEVALELGFWENRVGMEIAWYRNRSSDQLLEYPLSTITGFPSVFSNRDALVQNTGFEGALWVTLLKSKKISWKVSCNLTLPKNKLVRFDGLENSPYATDFKVGEPLSIQWLYVYKGVNPQTGYYEFEDLNHDGIISIYDNRDRRLTSAMDQQYYGGLTNTIQYNGLELSFVVQYSRQPGFRYLPMMPGFFGNQPAYVLDRWFTVGDQTNTQKFSASNGQLGYLLLQKSTYNREDASFIRLKSLSVSYLFSPKLVKKLKLEQARIFIHGQNLLAITGYTGLDPETGSGLPPLRMITGGLSFKL